MLDGDDGMTAVSIMRSKCVGGTDEEHVLRSWFSGQAASCTCDAAFIASIDRVGARKSFVEAVQKITVDDPRADTALIYDFYLEMCQSVRCCADSQQTLLPSQCDVHNICPTIDDESTAGAGLPLGPIAGGAVGGLLLAAGAVLFVRRGGAKVSVTGTVQDAGTGQPLAGALVSLGKGKADTVTADADGIFVVELRAGAVSVLRASMEGFRPLVQACSAPKKGQVAPSGGIILELEFIVYPVGGRVVDAATGKPISGALVTVTTAAGLMECDTNTEGEWSCGKLPPSAAVHAVVRAERYREGTASLKETLAGPVGPGGALDVELVREPILLSGRVRSSESDRPLEGAEVKALDAGSGEFLATATTDKDGNYTVAVAHGKHPKVTLVASATSHASAEAAADVDDDDVAVDDLRAVTLKYDLSGCVVDSRDSEPIGGSELAFLDADSEETLVTTDTEGKYEVRLPAGEYTRRVVCPGYDNAYATVAVVEDAANCNIELEIEKNEVSGTITEVDGDGPFAGATVELLDAESAVVASAVTNEAGEYSLAAPPAAYTRRVSAPDFDTVEDTVQLQNGDAIVNDELKPTVYTVEGCLSDAETNYRLSGAEVVLVNSDGDVMGRTYADDDGEYNFKARAGEYKARVTLDGYSAVAVPLSVGVEADARRRAVADAAAGQADDADPADSAAGAAAAVASMVMPEIVLQTATLVLRGMVESAGEQGGYVEDAEITLLDGNGTEVATTVSDGFGSYGLELNEGTYALRASASGYHPSVVPLVVDGGDVDQNFKLAEIAFAVYGTVKDLLNSTENTIVPVPAASITLNPAGGGKKRGAALKPSRKTGMSAEDGTFRIEGVRPGWYFAKFDADRYTTNTTTVEVPFEDIELDASVSLTRYAVYGRVSDAESGDALHDVRVVLLGATGDQMADARTGEGGEYAFEDLLCANYTVHVEATGFFKAVDIPAPIVDGDIEGVDAALECVKFNVSGRVFSINAGTGGLSGAVVWLKRNGKIKMRTVCGEDGTYTFGAQSGGLYNIVAAAEGHNKMRIPLELDADVAPGKGPADLVLPRPLPPDKDIGMQLVRCYAMAKSIFQYYCSAGSVGENNPFQMTLIQLDDFMRSLRLPDALSEPQNPTVNAMFGVVNGPVMTSLKIDQKGQVAGGLRPDPNKKVDDAITFDEFMDLLVRLSWLVGKRGHLSVNAFPHTRRGVGYALALFMEEVVAPRAERLEMDEAFERAFKKFKYNARDARDLKRAWDSRKTGGRAVGLGAFVTMCKDWRCTGNKVSIMKARSVYVQFADDDRGKLPFFLKDETPTKAVQNFEEAAMFEEEEDDDVVEARLEALRRAAVEANIDEEEEIESEAIEVIATMLPPPSAAAAPPPPAPDLHAAEPQDALMHIEDLGGSSKAGRGGVRGGDQEMSLSEFKAGVAYLAWLLCKGKTLADRVDMFMSVHYKSV